jgi:hypothetical protein
MRRNAVGKHRQDIRKDPAAREALQRFKYEIASEMGVLYPGFGKKNTTPSGGSGTVGSYIVDKMIASQRDKM